MIGDPWIRKLLRRIHDRGHEIGFHGSYDSFDRPDTIKAERDRLSAILVNEGIDQPVVGGRQHYLRFRNPTTWAAWDEAGLAYDSTLGFSERPAFRCGTCREYPLFDVVRRRRLALRERPLALMDSAILSSRAYDEAVARVRRVKGICRLFGGDFTLLWHNSRLGTRYERDLYAEVLDA